MAIIGLDHVQIAIPAGGEDRARAFYAGLLGMTEVAKPATLSPAGCWFVSGHVQIHLGIDPAFRAATKAHPALLVDDLDGLRSRLEAAGYETRDDKPIAGYRRFFTEDPFGNRIELMAQV
ncbi:MAG: VOC family protein [Erythrobacter sp.]|nr:VOC family protein [Erythrobacter sp.]